MSRNGCDFKISRERLPVIVLARIDESFDKFPDDPHGQIEELRKDLENWALPDAELKMVKDMYYSLILIVAKPAGAVDALREASSWLIRRSPNIEVLNIFIEHATEQEKTEFANEIYAKAMDMLKQGQLASAHDYLRTCNRIDASHRNFTALLFVEMCRDLIRALCHLELGSKDAQGSSLCDELFRKHMSKTVWDKLRFILGASLFFLAKKTQSQNLAFKCQDYLAKNLSSLFDALLRHNPNPNRHIKPAGHTHNYQPRPDRRRY